MLRRKMKKYFNRLVAWKTLKAAIKAGDLETGKRILRMLIEDSKPQRSFIEQSGIRSAEVPFKARGRRLV